MRSSRFTSLSISPTISRAGGQQRRIGVAEHSLEWRVWALVTGHDEPEGKPGGHDGPHHHADCAVCSSLGTLAGFAPAAIVPLPVPIRVEAPILLAATPASLLPRLQPRTAPALLRSQRLI